MESEIFNLIKDKIGKKHTEETKKKIGNANRGKKRSEETRGNGVRSLFKHSVA